MNNPSKPNFKTEIMPLICIIFAILSGVYFYFHLPAKIPIHWNFAGEVDGWGSGHSHAIFFPALVVGMYLLFLFLPYLDPRKEKYEQFAKVYHIFKGIIIFVLTLIYFLTSLVGLGYTINIGIVTPLLIGSMFLLMGNYMGKLKSNWFVGIKTPWTLSSEVVWNKTHRLGGKIFMLSGILIMIDSIAPMAFRLPIFIFTMVFMLFGTIGSSYVFYLIENKKNKAANIKPDNKI
jgi:uncharacterized membrane protein